MVTMVTNYKNFQADVKKNTLFLIYSVSIPLNCDNESYGTTNITYVGTYRNLNVKYNLHKIRFI